ncbi:MAG: RsmE family RNA methyltransferase [Coriobacteriia bacterium]
MSAPRFFLSGALAPEIGPLPLSEADRHHLRDVLRLEVDEEIVAVTPAGEAYRVRLTQIGPDAIEGEVVGLIDAPDVPRVWLVQGLAKGEKMDLVVRMATEIGVERIVPLATSRSVVRLDAGRAEARVERWQRIVAGAAKQAQLTRIPEVAPLTDVARLSSDLTGTTLTLIAWEDAAGAPGIASALAQASPAADAPVAIIVGPEGGFSAEEVALLVGQGARVVSLGDTVLRTETAGVVAAALTLAARGGLGGA